MKTNTAFHLEQQWVYLLGRFHKFCNEWRVPETQYIYTQKKKLYLNGNNNNKSIPPFWQIKNVARIYIITCTNINKKCIIWRSHTLPLPIPCTNFREILLDKLFLFINLKFSREQQFNSSTPVIPPLIDDIDRKNLLEKLLELFFSLSFPWFCCFSFWRWFILSSFANYHYLVNVYNSNT